jgi:putative nucleotidyltransferase with HDIG domain
LPDDIDQLVGDAFELPAAPLVAQRVLSVTADEASSAADLVKVIGPDAGLTARILRVANSSMYGRTQEIATLQTAVVSLGFPAVRNLVMGACAREVYGSFGTHEKLLWEHSVGTGIAALHVSKRTGRTTLDEAFTAGLFHDIGRSIFVTQCLEQFAPVADRLGAGGDDVLALEADTFGFEHTSVGGALLRRWQFPRPLMAAARLHHNPELLKLADDPVKALVATTSIANTICHAIGIGVTGGKSLTMSAIRASAYLKITPEAIKELAEEARQTYERDSHLFL